METPITDTQKRIIKELVDDIIVNRGILKMPAHLADLDGLIKEDIYRLAFRYYKMIINGESPLDIDRFTAKVKSPAGVDASIELYRCIGCNSPLSDDDIASRMPVCETCRKWVRVDFEILRDLFQ